MASTESCIVDIYNVCINLQKRSVIKCMFLGSVQNQFALKSDKNKNESGCVETHRGAIDVGEGEQNSL